MRRKFSAVFSVLFLLMSIVPNVHAQDARMQNVGQKYNLAVSDYLEAIASCNGALRKSAERQFRRLRDKCDMYKNEAHRNYVQMAGLLNRTYQELGQYFDEPSTGKMLMDQVINAAGLIPGVGAITAAYSAVNTLYSYADEHIRSRDGKAILNRAKNIFKDMEKYDQDYKIWDDFEKEISRREDGLARQFDRNCAGRDTAEWRYNDNLPPAVVDQSGIANVDLVGRDQASGQIFDGRASNNTGQTIIIVFGPGSMLFPLDDQIQRMIITEGQPITLGPGQTVEFPLSGFCADPFAYPPPSERDSWFPGELALSVPWFPPPGEGMGIPGELTIPPNNPFNGEFLSVPRIPGTIEGMLEGGEIPRTGLPPDMERITLPQWYIWNIFENFNEDDGRGKITEQVREGGGTQTPEQIGQLNKNIWSGISLVKKRVRTQTR